MTCDCKHAVGGDCRRFPPVPVIEMGRTAWRFPAAKIECGEKAVLTPEIVKDEAKIAKAAKHASEPATKPHRAKKASAKASHSEKEGA